MYQLFDLLQFRKINHLSQKQVADILGVTRNYISIIEQGKSTLSRLKIGILTDESRGYLLPPGYARETPDLGRLNPLVALRKENDLTQQQLADFLGIKTSYMSMLENGKAPLSQDKIDKIMTNGKDWETGCFEKALERTEKEKTHTPTLNIRDVNVGSNIGGHHNTIGGDDTEVAVLRERVAMLERLLEEKERLISVLMKNA